MWELDHVFIMTPVGAPEAGAIEDRGFALGGRGSHAGQGTANCWFPFENAYVELLYATDDRLLRSEPVLPTLLWERSRWCETGTSPFGVCLRGGGEWPVPTWGYHALFLPPGASIPVALDAAGSRAPLLFFNARPVSGRPPGANPQRITAVRIESPVMPVWLDAISRIAPSLKLVEAPRHSMLIELDSAPSGHEVCLGALAPLTLRW